ncbi:MAG TPA: Rad52/Rad22 family DNA repair protein [Gemmataceae bacterium]|nr:Rad52/Rad22 family DNA repair protein [Gemmataceae bacterium]
MLIAIDDRGIPTLEIDSANGEVSSYRGEPVDGGFELHNLANGERYRVSPHTPNLWHCSCPAWKFRKSKKASRGCKHAAAVMHLVKLLMDYRVLIAPYLEILPMPEASPQIDALVSQLSAPFDPREVKFKPAVISGNRALALAYVDARVIQDRLDRVLGVTGWQDEYQCLPDGSVVCQLRLRLGGEWITKMDVGGQSEQPDEGDRRKAAFSDALKRAAVKFGIGRYLYRLPSQWVEYNPQKKQLASTPTLPDWALPRKSTQVAGQTPAPSKAKLAKPGSERPPSDGIELEQRLGVWDQRAAQAQLLRPGMLRKVIVDWAIRESGVSAEITKWPRLVVEAAWAELQRYSRDLVSQKKMA